MPTQTALVGRTYRTADGFRYRIIALRGCGTVLDVECIEIDGRPLADPPESQYAIGALLLALREGHISSEEPT